MYQTIVPVQTSTLDRYDREEYVQKLKNMGVKRVFLCPAGDFAFWENQERELESLKRNTVFMHERGFEVGVWVWTFMYAGKSDYTYMRSPDGKVSASNVCPTDPAYRERMGRFVQDAARCGVDIFMFDDDYRFGFIDIGFGCCCDRHLKMISDEVGETVTLPQMEKAVLRGGGNRYRTAFLHANGKSLEDFASCMRKYLDAVNPDVRMGFCSCITSWDIDGTTPDRIALLLAGKTRPFYRLIGAPYWANERNWGNRLADVIEMERWEASERKNTDIEIFSEGDTFPRPRYKVPAVFLESFDTALRVAGCTDGILKYVFDYSSEPSDETGYYRAHMKNKAVYEDIERIFSDKKAVGIRVWNQAAKMQTFSVPAFQEGKTDVQHSAFPYASRFLTACSLPTVYEGSGCCGIAFGDDVRMIPEERLSDGLILDIRACEILSEAGIDTGITRFGDVTVPHTEIYDNNNHVAIGGGRCRKVTVSEKAGIESRFLTADGVYPASFRYENAEGQRFLVYCFDGYCNHESLARQYPRAGQLIDAVHWLSGKSLPVVCQGNPDLYLQAKQSGNRIAVALWNLFPDCIDSPVVRFEKNVKCVQTRNCSAVFLHDTVTLSAIPAYGFAILEAELTDE